jgi:hypothetical protein
MAVNLLGIIMIYSILTASLHKLRKQLFERHQMLTEQPIVRFMSEWIMPVDGRDMAVVLLT